MQRRSTRQLWMQPPRSVIQGHTWDKTHQKRRAKDRQNRKTSTQKDQKDNPSGSEVANLSFAQLGKGSCYCCGLKGHAFSDCPKKAAAPKAEKKAEPKAEAPKAEKKVAPKKAAKADAGADDPARPRRRVPAWRCRRLASQRVHGPPRLAHS